MSHPSVSPNNDPKLWGKMARINTPEDYFESLLNRGLKVMLMGEYVCEPTQHPMIASSVNAMAETYRLALEEQTVGSVQSPIADMRINRFLHIAQSAGDLVDKARMQRNLGRRTGTCFQRCVGLDAINALHSVTFDIDAAKSTNYHARFLAFLKTVQQRNQVIAGAMTDAKGDRSKAPHKQDDLDLYVRVTHTDDAGVYISGAKLHQTGSINSHWLIVMPTLRLSEADAAFAIVGAIPVHARGITYIYGRQASDTRSLEPGTMNQGNASYSGQEVTIIFDDVFIPWEHVFMHGEYEFAASLVERFTTYHRCSYVCKSGVGDVLIGAAAEVAEKNGVDQASHIKDKLVEMVHLNETLRAGALASAHEAKPLASGVYLNDPMLANVSKQNVTRFPYEIARLAQDIAGGLMVTMPSEQDLSHEAVGPVVRKYLAGRSSEETEDRLRLLRLIENLTLGRNAVGYLTESLHGAGSPQAQRIQIARGADLDQMRGAAKRLAGVSND